MVPHKREHNRREFNNHELILLCENVNKHSCTTLAESPSSNNLAERQNATLDYTRAKITTDIKSDLDLSLAWAVSA